MVDDNLVDNEQTTNNQGEPDDVNKENEMQDGTKIKNDEQTEDLEPKDNPAQKSVEPDDDKNLKEDNKDKDTIEETGEVITDQVNDDKIEKEIEFQVVESELPLANIPVEFPKDHGLQMERRDTVKMFADEYKYIEYQDVKLLNNLKDIESMKEQLIQSLDKGLYEFRVIAKEAYKLSGNKRIYDKPFEGKSRTLSRKFAQRRLKKIFAPVKPLRQHFDRISFLKDFNDFYEKIIDEGLNIDSKVRKQIASIRFYEEFAEIAKLTREELIQFKKWIHSLQNNIKHLKSTNKRFEFPKWNMKIEAALETGNEIPLSEISEDTEEQKIINYSTKETTEMTNEKAQDIEALETQNNEKKENIPAEKQIKEPVKNKEPIINNSVSNTQEIAQKEDKNEANTQTKVPQNSDDKNQEETLEKKKNSNDNDNNANNKVETVNEVDNNTN